MKRLRRRGYLLTLALATIMQRLRRKNSIVPLFHILSKENHKKITFIC
jgi:hypothetical protein